jgi:hypothetical protein
MEDMRIFKMSIKAIETFYGGYRFRSRLEARWAVFFDYLGIKFQYELEGYDLDGEWYLPDFWLSDSKIWLEIKPPNGECPALEKLFYAQNAPCALACGIPGEELFVWVSDTTDSSGGSQLWDRCDWALNKNGMFSINTHNKRKDRTFYNGSWGGCISNTVLSEFESFPIPNMGKAIDQAKQYRF